MNINEVKEHVLDCIAEELDAITSRHMKSLKRYPTIEDNLKYLNKLLSYLKTTLELEVIEMKFHT